MSGWYLRSDLKNFTDVQDAARQAMNDQEMGAAGVGATELLGPHQRPNKVTQGHAQFANGARGQD